MNRWSLNAAAAAAFFWAAIFHGSSWQTQSRLPNISDGWRTEGWASRQLPHFWKWFSFFPLSRHANKLASKNVSLAFLIGEMFLRVGEKMMSLFFFRALFVLCLCIGPFASGSVRHVPHKHSTLLSVKYVTLLTLYLILLLMLAHCCGGDNQPCRQLQARRSISALFHSPFLPPRGCVALFKLRCSAAQARHHY